MPKTFSDAVHFTRGIQVPYLWIDSLCIVQDDAAEWEAESTKMASIYENSIVTLVAAEAVNSKGGLFPRIEPGAEKTSTISWPCEGSEASIVYTREYEGVKEWRTYNSFLPRSEGDNSEPVPLFERAWTFQELVLPPRLLICSRKGPVWHCNSAFHPATEDQPLQWRPHHKETLFHSLSPSGKGVPKTLMEFSASLPEYKGNLPNYTTNRKVQRTYAQNWTDLVEKYTRRHLTKRADRLRAFAGVVTRFQARAGRNFLCGLWDDKRALAYLLSWDSGEQESSRPVCDQPEVCKASFSPPSWSWAAIECPITWPSTEFGFESLIDVVDTSCIPSPSSSSLTNSLGGRITIIAKLLQLKDCWLVHAPFTEDHLPGPPAQSHMWHYTFNFEGICTPLEHRQLSHYYFEGGSPWERHDSVLHDMARMIYQSPQGADLNYLTLDALACQVPEEPNTRMAHTEVADDEKGDYGKTDDSIPSPSNPSADATPDLQIEIPMPSRNGYDYHQFDSMRGADEVRFGLNAILLAAQAMNNINNRWVPQIMLIVKDRRAGSDASTFLRVDSGSRLLQVFESAGLDGHNILARAFHRASPYKLHLE